MMRMVEALFVVVILSGALLGALNYMVIPSPTKSSSRGLEDTGLTLLRSLDEGYNLTNAAFSTSYDDYAATQRAIDYALPPNIVYNLTTIRLNTTHGSLEYIPEWSISNIEGPMPKGSKTITYTVTNPDVTIKAVRGYIGVGDVELTLYILNLSDCYTWWPSMMGDISLAQDIYDQLSPWFVKTVMIDNYTDYNLLLAGYGLGGEIKNAVVINPLGGTVPVPKNETDLNSSALQDQYSNAAYFLGKATNKYNWTYMCYVGYPSEYFENPGSGNGLSGITELERKCLYGYIDGIDNWTIRQDPGTEIRQKEDNPAAYSDKAKDIYTKYGVFPGINQPNIFTLKKNPLDKHHLILDTDVFEGVAHGNDIQYSGAFYRHYIDSNGNDSLDPGEAKKGVFFTLCLPQVPDPRISTIGMLQYYQPQIYRTSFTERDTIRFVVFTLAQMGAD